MCKTSRSMVLVKPEQMELRDITIPKVEKHDLLLKIEMVGICGTDKAIYQGYHEQKHYPMIMGHEVVGRVEQIGDSAREAYKLNVGDRVTVEPFISCKQCDYCKKGFYQLCIQKTCYGLTKSIHEFPFANGAYSDYMFILPNSKLHRIEENVSAQAACMSSVLGNGVRWIKTKGQLKKGDTVVIIGPGAQGLASTIVAKALGASKIIVTGLATDENKLVVAKELGATHTLVTGKDDIVSEINHITGGDNADVVVVCTGAEKAVQLGMDVVKPLGKVVLIGKNGWKPIPFMIDKIVNQEIEIIGGYGQAGDTEYAVELINSNRHSVEKIVSHTFSLSEANEAMKLFVERPEECIRVALKL